MCDKMKRVIEMLINSVIKNEAIRNEQMIKEYEKQMEDNKYGQSNSKWHNPWHDGTG